MDKNKMIRTGFAGALALVLAVSSLEAKQDSTKTERFNAGGIDVILRQNKASNVVAVNLYLLGGSRQITKENAGIEPLLLTVSERGTKNYPKEKLLKTMSMLGSQIVIGPNPDWTVVGIRTIGEVFDSTWMVFADRLMYPTLDAGDVSLLKTQFLSAVRQKDDDADGLVSSLADSIALVGHPYANSVTGTVASIGSLTPAALKAYHASQIVKSRMMLVVVGDVTKERIEKLIASTIANLPQGDYKWTLPEAVPRLDRDAIIVDRKLPTNYILGYFSGPLATSEDYHALRIATTVLTGRMFSEIRGRQNLTYDVNSPFLDRAASMGGLYVTTVQPDTTLKLMKFFMEEIRREYLSPVGLKRMELEFLTDYFMENETNASQADFLARAQLFQGDYRLADKLVDQLKTITPEAVRAAAILYMRNLRFAYVGDPSKVDPKLLKSF